MAKVYKKTYRTKMYKINNPSYLHRPCLYGLVRYLRATYFCPLKDHIVTSKHKKPRNIKKTSDKLNAIEQIYRAGELYG